MRWTPLIGRMLETMDWATFAEAEEVKTPGNAGERIIEGMNCFRIGPLGVVEEGWFSLQLQHMIWERSNIGKKTYVWRMHSLAVGEPDPGLFVIPPTFTKAS